MQVGRQPVCRVANPATKNRRLELCVHVLCAFLKPSPSLIGYDLKVLEYYSLLIYVLIITYRRYFCKSQKGWQQKMYQKRDLLAYLKRDLFLDFLGKNENSVNATKCSTNGI